MSDIDALCQTLKEDVNWNPFFTIVKHIGDDLNGRKDRFDKSDVLEMALEGCSDKCVKWVDVVGWDHEVQLHDMKLNVEMKSQKFCLYTKKGNLKKKSSSIKIMNSLGDASKRSRNDVLRFDSLLIVDTGNPSSFSCALIQKSEIKDTWLDFSKDGVTLQAPTSALTFVRSPTDIEIEERSIQNSYKDLKAQAQRKYFEQFIKG